MNDINIYNKQMAQAIEDKLWFTRFLDMPTFRNSIVYDFGCADGNLIRHLAPRYPDIPFVGIDNSSEMVDLARQKQIYKNESYVEASKFHSLHFLNKTKIVIMSSVIHEVMNYSEYPCWQIRVFLNKVRPDYIFFRDMVPDESIYRKSSKEDFEKVFYKDWDTIDRKAKYSDQLFDFEYNSGSLTRQRNLVHFLLKYRYLENWAREVEEDYFPFTYDFLLSYFWRFFNMKPIYSKRYILPFIKENVKETFGIDLRDNTHVNIIFKPFVKTMSMEEDYYPGHPLPFDNLSDDLPF